MLRRRQSVIEGGGGGPAEGLHVYLRESESTRRAVDRSKHWSTSIENLLSGFASASYTKIPEDVGTVSTHHIEDCKDLPLGVYDSKYVQ